MPTDNVVEFVSKAEQSHMLFAMVILPLARMIHSGRIDPETVTREKFFDALIGLGKSHDDAFEILVTRVEEEMRLIEHCLNEGEAKSGVVLLFTLIEGEVNALIRILLRIRGFSAGTITDALRGSDFDTKIDVLLPLLGVSVAARLRNAALQCKAVRNLVVHNKASPALMSAAGNRPSDSEAAQDRAEQFFAENPVARLAVDLAKFLDAGVAEDPSFQWGQQLFDRFYERGET
ncbi:hypothetical protein NYO99_14245 [Pelomonas sp. UHG3]|uniref:Uncharacterized protein n=1 Tax=Roseateles hydrophilus TaxID=2975054 RepID=A0ACC6CCH7_9BURK|nr:hypothetical protein [Pelomonas sp. UHG3]MCY4746143.1 hypothetical protein [Pelomonas sp. UHG3]